MDKLQQEIDDLLHGVPEHVGALAWTQDVIAVLKQAATALQSSGGEVVFGYVGAFSADLMKKYTNADHNASAEVWMRRRSAHDIPVYLASPAQPSGFVLVPVEPTRKMCDDAVHAAVHGSHGSPWFPHAWRAALKAAAAPAPIEQEG